MVSVIKNVLTTLAVAILIRIIKLLVRAGGLGLCSRDFNRRDILYYLLFIY